MIERFSRSDMTRRQFFSSTMAAGVAARPALSGESARPPVFPGTPFHRYPRCLPDYLSRLARRAVEKRNAELAKLVSPTAIETRQKWVRSTLWKLIGGMPERTPLNPRTVSSFDRDSYKVEKVIYESRPGLFIPANLYLPKKGSGPFPAVLFQSGHYEEAKAYPNYQRCCQALVQLGFVVLAFDPMGQGERVGYLSPLGNRSRLSSPDAEHTTPGKQMLLYGDSSTRYQLWDAMRSLDYLASLPMVDAKRIGSAGHSGGGTLTMLLAAADGRLAAAAPCMGNIENVAALPFVAPGSTDDAEQDFVGAGPLGFDRWDLFYPFTPKPMLIWPSDADFIATYSSQYIVNAWDEFLKLKRSYEVMGQADHLGWADTPLPHSLAYDSRMLIYNWFRRWLAHDPAPLREEPPVKPEPLSVLQVTESGNVTRSLNSATPFSLNRGRQVRRTPMALEAMLGVTRAQPGWSAKTIGRAQSGKVLVEVLEVAPDSGVWLPAWLLTHASAAKDKAVLLVLDPVDAVRLWFQPDADTVVIAGSPVICAVDVRGVGALQPEFSPGAPEYAGWHRQEENYAWGSMILGKALVGQRVTDILAVAAALRKHPAASGRPIRVAASGKLTVPALFAAALDPKIEALYLAGGLVSFQDVVESEQYAHPFANFVPGFLNHTDLPEIAATLAPRRLLLAGVVNASDKTLDAATVRRIYEAADRSGSLSIEDSAEWTASRLIRYGLAT